MKRSIILYIFILTFSLTSCKNEVQNWIDSYAKTKCSYQKALEKQKADSIKILNPIYKQLKQLENNILRKEKPFTVKAEKLIQLNSNIEIDYLKKHRQITDAQSIKYGHISTPEYANKIAQIEKQRNILIDKNNAKLQVIELEKSSDKELNYMLQKKFI